MPEERGFETVSANYLGIPGLTALGRKMGQFTGTERESEIIMASPDDSYACLECGSTAFVKHGYDESVRYLDIPLGHILRIIELQRPRRRCRNCNSLKARRPRSFVENHKITQRLRRYLIAEALTDTISFPALHRRTEVLTDTISAIFYEEIARRDACRVITSARVLSFDEVYLKDPEPACVVVDPETKRVIEVVDSIRRPYALHDFLTSLPWGQQVEAVCIDLTNSYARVVREALPNAQIVADRFHVVQLVNKAVDRVRIDLERTLPRAQRQEVHAVLHKLRQPESVLKREAFSSVWNSPMGVAQADTFDDDKGVAQK